MDNDAENSTELSTESKTEYLATLEAEDETETERENDMKNENGTKMENGIGLAKLIGAKWKLIMIAVLVLGLLAMGGLIKHQSNVIEEKEKMIEELQNEPIIVSPVNPEIVLQTISDKLADIGELATAEYLYTNAAKFTDSKDIKGVTLPFTKKSFILKWDGVVKAGIDVNELSVTLGSKAYTLKVCMPATKILSHEVESAEVLDEKSGLFNRITVTDKTEFDEQTKQEMENRAIERGLLEQAQENAETVITRLLNANPDVKKDYTIEFETIE